MHGFSALGWVGEEREKSRPAALGHLDARRWLTSEQTIATAHAGATPRPRSWSGSFADRLCGEVKPHSRSEGVIRAMASQGTRT